MRHYGIKLSFRLKYSVLIQCMHALADALLAGFLAAVWIRVVF